jgi:acyl-CoA thioesterase-1
MRSLSILLTLFAICLVGCLTRPDAKLARQFGESVVFIGEEPAALAHPPLRRPPFSMRSTYLPEAATVSYLEGRDFVIDYRAGTLLRAPGSRLPDFRTNMLFGQHEFDHSKFPGFGNQRFFAFVDYDFAPTSAWPIQPEQVQHLRATQAKLAAGEPVKIVAFGDSITAGGDASKPELVFWRRWADELQRQHPRSRVTAVNGATGGDTTVQGLQRLPAKVLDEKPDLVLIGFGMNDHNIGSVPLPQFQQNLEEIVDRIRQNTEAEIILFSAFPPNPEWKFGSHRMPLYAAVTAAVARGKSCAFADVFNNWQSLAARKKPEDLLGNNINHPNDFGHWIYFRVFEELGL